MEQQQPKFSPTMNNALRADGLGPLMDSMVNAERGKPLQQAEKRGEIVVAALSLVNAALGAGVLAYPFAFMSAGLVAANIVTAVMGAMSITSLCIIMHCMAVAQERHGRAKVASYGDLVLVALGGRASAALEVLIVAYMFGASVGYLEVLRDVFNGFVKDEALHRMRLSRTAFEMLVMGATTAVCFVLCVARKIDSLKYSAAVAVLAVLFTVGTLVYQALTDPCTPSACNGTAGPGWEHKDLGVSPWPESVASLLKAFPLICFAFQCHIQCALVYHDLSPPPF